MDETKPRRSVCPKATNPTAASLPGQWLQSCYQQFALLGRVNCCSRWSVTLWHTVGKGKGKVHPTTGHTAQKGSRGIALLFLDTTIEGIEWSASRPGRFYRREKPGIHCTGV